MSFSLEPTVAVPYPGLRPFLREESQVFFGRDRQIDEILARLKRNQFLGVVGTSGCGKSSLIRAGILPALESGLMGEIGSTWYVADMKPGDAPLTNLAKGLIKSGVLGQRWSDTPEGIALLTAALRRSDVSLVNLIQQVQLPPYTNLLVLADQFEEIFRFQQQDPNEALAFVNLLLTSGRDRSVPIYVVLTMRTDFLGNCSLFPGLPEALNDSQYLCPRLTRDQLTEAIEGPAAVFGGEVEQSLVTQIVNDAGANSDQLPLVQHVLARMWHRIIGDRYGTGAGRTERVLRLDDYREVGGLNGKSPPSGPRTGNSSLTSYAAAEDFTNNALSQHADEAYFSLSDGTSTNEDHGRDHKPSRKQMIAQMLFRCLAEWGPSGQYVRRPVKVQYVAAVAGCSVPEAIEVVEVFRREDRSFLTPAVPKPNSLDKVPSDLKPETMLDISHEALIRQWQRFGGQHEQVGEHESAQSWLQIEEQSRRRDRRLAEAAENEKIAGLLRDPELGFLNQWWEDFRPTQAWADACMKDSFDPTESFLKRSLEDLKQKRKEADEEQKRLSAEREKILLDKVNAETRRAEAEAQRARDAESAAVRFRRLTIAAGIAFLFAIVFMVVALYNWRNAIKAVKNSVLAQQEATSARKALAAALDSQLRMFREPTELCGGIAAAATAELNDGNKARINHFVNELKIYQPRPFSPNDAIGMHIEKLSEAVRFWKAKESDTDQLLQSVLLLARQYRIAWQEFSMRFQPDFKRQSWQLLVEPVYKRVIEVTRRLIQQPTNSQARADFEGLYWGELVFVETQAVEIAMVQFRRGLDGDGLDLPRLADELERAVRHALDASTDALPK